MLHCSLMFSKDEIAENTLIRLAIALLNPITSNKESAICMRSESIPSFFSLYQKITVPMYRIKRQNEVWKILEASERFLFCIHGFSFNMFDREKVKKVYPSFFDGISSKRPLKFSNLSFRKRTISEYMIDIQEIALSYNSLQSFEAKKDIPLIVANIYDYVSLAHLIYDSNFKFKIPLKLVNKKKNSLNLKIRNGLFVNENIKRRSVEYIDRDNYVPYVMSEEILYRINTRITKDNKYNDFNFGNTKNEVLESCIYLQKNVFFDEEKSKKGKIRFYRNDSCVFSDTHHADLPSYKIYSTNNGNCVACEYFWPYIIDENSNNKIEKRENLEEVSEYSKFNVNYGDSSYKINFKDKKWMKVRFSADGKMLFDYGMSSDK